MVPSGFVNISHRGASAYAPKRCYVIGAYRGIHAVVQSAPTTATSMALAPAMINSKAWNLGTILRQLEPAPTTNARTE